MHIDLSSQQPAGLVVRAGVDFHTISIWYRDQELIATVDHKSAITIARALSEREGIAQVSGVVSEFSIPPLR